MCIIGPILPFLPAGGSERTPWRNEQSRPPHCPPGAAHHWAEGCSPCCSDLMPVWTAPPTEETPAGDTGVRAAHIRHTREDVLHCKNHLGHEIKSHKNTKIWHVMVNDMISLWLFGLFMWGGNLSFLTNKQFITDLKKLYSKKKSYSAEKHLIRFHAIQMIKIQVSGSKTSELKSCDDNRSYWSVAASIFIWSWLIRRPARSAAGLIQACVCHFW